MTNRQWQTCEKCGKQYIDEESDICPQCQDELYCELCNLEDVTPKSENVTWSASGVVIGKDFYGNVGSYPTNNYASFDTKEHLLEKINLDFADNSLDAGFGFDRLLAARMHVCMKHTIVIDGKDYTHEEWQNVDIGDTSLIDKLTKENDNE